jgi:L-aminopeptidase/D-esterase-like protein
VGFLSLLDEVHATFNRAKSGPVEEGSFDRLGLRAIMGLSRTDSFASNGSSDYVISFSTHPSVRKPRTSDTPIQTQELVNASMSPLSRQRLRLLRRRCITRFLRRRR